MPIKYSDKRIQINLERDFDLVLDMRELYLYKRFQRKLRELFATEQASHGIPIVYLNDDSSNIILVKFIVKDDIWVGFAIRQWDCYLFAVCNSKGVWFELNEDSTKPRKFVIFGSIGLPLGLNYGELAPKNFQLTDCKFSEDTMTEFVTSLGGFDPFKNGKKQKVDCPDAFRRALFTCTVFICEGARFAPVEELIFRGITTSDATTIGGLENDFKEKLGLEHFEKLGFASHELDFIHNWRKMSDVLLRADNSHSVQLCGIARYVDILSLVKGTDEWLKTLKVKKKKKKKKGRKQMKKASN